MATLEPPFILAIFYICLLTATTAQDAKPQLMQLPAACQQPYADGGFSNETDANFTGTTRWTYRQDTATCILFMYKGDLGNDNNYMSRTECETACITFRRCVIVPIGLSSDYGEPSNYWNDVSFTWDGVAQYYRDDEHGNATVFSVSKTNPGWEYRYIDDSGNNTEFFVIAKTDDDAVNADRASNWEVQVFNESAGSFEMSETFQFECLCNLPYHTGTSANYGTIFYYNPDTYMCEQKDNFAGLINQADGNQNAFENETSCIDACEYVQLCDNRTCGTDGYGGSCGTCTNIMFCDDNGVEAACVDGCADIVCTPPVNFSCYEVTGCDSASGVCQYGQVSEGSQCDNGDPYSECMFGECTTVDLCTGADCLTCPGCPDVCIETGTCDIYTGACVYEYSTTDTECDDEDANTINDRCVSDGVCGCIPICNEDEDPNDRCGDDYCGGVCGTCAGGPSFCSSSCVVGNCSDPNGEVCSQFSAACLNDGDCQPKMWHALEQLGTGGLCDLTAAGTANSADDCWIQHFGLTTNSFGYTEFFNWAQCFICHTCDIDTSGTNYNCDLCTGVDCYDPYDPCVALAVCDPVDGQCDYTYQQAGSQTPCDDEDPTTAHDYCLDGGQCGCVPSCYGSCGSDGCGGTCGGGCTGGLRACASDCTAQQCTSLDVGSPCYTFYQPCEDINDCKMAMWAVQAQLGLGTPCDVTNPDSAATIDDCWLGSFGYTVDTAGYDEFVALENCYLCDICFDRQASFFDDNNVVCSDLCADVECTGQCVVNGTCDPSTGDCAYAYYEVGDNQSCNDQNDETLVDFCLAGGVCGCIPNCPEGAECGGDGCGNECVAGDSCGAGELCGADCTAKTCDDVEFHTCNSYFTSCVANGNCDDAMRFSQMQFGTGHICDMTREVAAAPLECWVDYLGFDMSDDSDFNLFTDWSNCFLCESCEYDEQFFADKDFDCSLTCPYTQEICGCRYDCKSSINACMTADCMLARSELFDQFIVGDTQCIQRVNQDECFDGLFGDDPYDDSVGSKQTYLEMVDCLGRCLIDNYDGGDGGGDGDGEDGDGEDGDGEDGLDLDLEDFVVGIYLVITGRSLSSWSSPAEFWDDFSSELASFLEISENRLEYVLAEDGSIKVSFLLHGNVLFTNEPTADVLYSKLEVGAVYGLPGDLLSLVAEDSIQDCEGNGVCKPDGGDGDGGGGDGGGGQGNEECSAHSDCTPYQFCHYDKECQRCGLCTVVLAIDSNCDCETCSFHEDCDIGYCSNLAQCEDDCTKCTTRGSFNFKCPEFDDDCRVKEDDNVGAESSANICNSNIWVILSAQILIAFTF